MISRKQTTFISILLFVVLISASCSVIKPGFKGELVKPAQAAPEINMTDDRGDAFRLSDQTGKVVLIYFGFTNCPDECPLTMGHLKQTMEELGDKAGNVKVVLVTTDPLRDTPAAMRAYLTSFNPSFLGIPGDPIELEKIYDAYGVEVEDGGETHTSLIYVVDQKGDLRLRIDSENTSEEIASDLRILLAEK